MVLQLITLIPFAALLAIPVRQRVAGSYSEWQGQISQFSVWAMLPLALIWGVVCLDDGSILQAGLCLALGLGLLMVGQSGGWETLISGRLTQLSLGSLSLVLITGDASLTQYLLAASLGILAFLYDSLLDLVGPAPQYDSIEDWERPVQGVSELGDSVVPGSTMPRPPLPVETAVLERPPLPDPGDVAEWTSQQAEQAARAAQQARQQAEWYRSRKV